MEVEKGKAPSAEPIKPSEAKLASCIYFVCGVAFLLPWNAFITAVDYWDILYPGTHPDRIFSVCYLPANFLTMVLLVHFIDRVNTRARIVGGLLIFFVAVLAMPILDAISNGRWGGVFLGITCAFLVLCGAADAFSQGGFFGEVAVLPTYFMQALTAGTAGSGVAISLLRIVTKAAFSDTRVGLRRATGVYFGVAAFFLLACLAAYLLVLPRLPIIIAARRRAAARAAAWRSRPPSGDDLLQGAKGLPEAEAGAVLITPPAVRTWSLLREVWDLALGMLAMYIITLAIFPGFLSEDVRPHADLGSWYPIILITLFNCGDLIGKGLPLAAPRLTLHHRPTLLLATLARAAFLPAFYFSARLAPPAAIMLITLLFGLSNGYLTVSNFSTGPLGYAEREQNLVSNLQVTCLILGLAVGSFASWLWLISTGW